MIKDILCPFCQRHHKFEEGVSKMHFYCPAVELQISLDIFSPRRQKELQTPYNERKTGDKCDQSLQQE